MIAAWMAFGVLVAGGVATSALLAERALLERGLPSRAAWAMALSLSILLPVGMFMLPAAAVTTTPVSTGTIQFLPAQAAAVERHDQSFVRVMSRLQNRPAQRSLDTWLMSGWIAMTSLLGTYIAMSSWSLHRRLRRARVAVVAGTTVAVLEDIGPAVAGFLNPRIVIPEWLLRADADTRELAIAHEREHLVARDMRLLGCMWIALILLPWNLPLWWQARRLRQAIEIDCDARVLMKVQPQNYGAALVDVAKRISLLRMAEPGVLLSSSFLEKRIRTMFSGRHEWSRSRAVGLSGCALLVLLATTSLSAPEDRPRFNSMNRSTQLPLLPSPVESTTAERRSLVQAIRYYHPQVRQLRPFERADIWAVVDEGGARVDSAIEVLPRDAPEISDLSAEFARRFGVAADKRQSVVTIFFARGEIAPGMVSLKALVEHVATATTTVVDEAAPRLAVMSAVRPAIENQVATIAATQLELITRFDNRSLDAGLPAGQELWFLLDASGVTLSAGRRQIITDPNLAKADLSRRYPGISVGYVERGTAVKGPDGRRLAVSWHWLDPESTPPQTDSRPSI